MCACVRVLPKINASNKTRLYSNTEEELRAHNADGRGVVFLPLISGYLLLGIYWVLVCIHGWSPSVSIQCVFSSLSLMLVPLYG